MYFKDALNAEITKGMITTYFGAKQAARVIAEMQASWINRGFAQDTAQTE